MAKVTKVEGKTVNQGALVKLVAEETGRSQNEVREILSALFTSIPNLLADGKKITVRNVFSLESHKKAPREGRNPRTGEKIQIAEKLYAKATFSKKLNAQLNSKK